MERNVDWSGVTYLSPIGILGAPGTNGLDAHARELLLIDALL
ncbi:hypothetical protein FF38_10583 [Lucilia cuprina]|uniref:Uncharacterized protein n=1 Tax=Lucilia cuprina TaxID=7375 RepID=A0A0L0C775_LUCCU|nr:hypothetical protein FF38_10583 [Lucilia cuprina]